MRILLLSLFIYSPCLGREPSVMSATELSPESGRDSPEWWDHHERLKERRYIAYRTRYAVIYGHRNHRYNFKFVTPPNLYGPAPFILNPRYYRTPARTTRSYIVPVPRL